MCTRWPEAGADETQKIRRKAGSDEELVPRRGLELSLEVLFHIDKSIGYALRFLLRSTHVPRSNQPGSGIGSQPLQSG